jgi:hypothetical protein
MTRIEKRISGFFFLLAVISQPVCALDISTSGRSEIGDNPFVATGFNKQTSVTTGYLSATRTAPGRTDECRFLFTGNLTQSKVVAIRYIFENEEIESEPAAISKAVMKGSPENLTLILMKNSLQADCEWILPFIGEPRIHDRGDELSISLGHRATGDWTGVYLIRALRARFHNFPSDSAKGKPFLVAGDVIYVYDERPGWYYVKYDGKKKKTVGWIKKSDTVQITPGGKGLTA